jgi:hypothetical protein
MQRAAVIAAGALIVAATAWAGSGSSLWNWFIIPGVAHVPGAQGTFWSTDISIVNPYLWQSITVRVEFLEINRDNTNRPSATYILGPGQARAVSDIVWTAFGVEASGSLIVSTDDGASFTTCARTYTGTAATYGQTENGQKMVHGGGDTAYVAGINQSTRFRTNVGAVNASDDPITVRARVYSDDGTIQGTKSFALQPWSHAQVSVASFAPNFGTGYVKWDCPSSGWGIQWVAYASVVDNTTGDAVFIEERADEEYTQYQHSLDLSGWWSGTFSGPLGTWDGFASVWQYGAELSALLFDSDGYLQGEMWGFEEQGNLSFEGGYSWNMYCWNDYLTDGGATATEWSISGSYTMVGDCVNGVTTFDLEPSSGPAFKARVGSHMLRYSGRNGARLGGDWPQSAAR